MFKYGRDQIPAMGSIHKPWHDPHYLTTEYWNRGFTIGEIANTCGVSDYAVEHQMKKHEIPRRNSKFTKKLTDDDVVRLREEFRRESMGVGELAREYGISQGYASQLIRGKSRKRAGGPII